MSQPQFSGQVIIQPSFSPRPGITHVLFDFDGTLSLVRQGWPEVMVPMFTEVSSNVLADARAMATRDAISALAQKAHDAMETAAKSGKSVADAARLLGVTVTNTPAFSASTGEDLEIPRFNELIRTLLTRNAGEVCEPVPTYGGVLVAYVAKRVPADVMSCVATEDGLATAVCCLQDATKCGHH